MNIESEGRAGKRDDGEDPIPENTNRSKESTSQICAERMGKQTLFIISYGHRYGPLSSKAPVRTPLQHIMSYDIRDLPNPPKHVRAHQTGLNKPLREWFFAREEVRSKFEKVCREIEQTLMSASTTARGEENPAVVEVYVGVFCEMGRHRSVSFVEELGRKTWVSYDADGRDTLWDTVITHRDAKRAKSSKRDSRNRRDQHGD